MKKLITLFLFVASSVFIYAQEKSQFQLYSVAFYNLENLFDTEDDPTILDDDFTPKGSYAWTETKYRKKLSNMAFVINRLAKEHTSYGPAIIGVSEVENRKVLEDLINTDELAKVGYGIVHYDSPDRRGIDVALLYNPTLFTLTSSKIYPYILPQDSTFKTRDQLLVSGILAGEPFHVIVNHWPSRSGSKSSELREFGASISKHIADSIYNADPDAKIVIMGDLNDDPTDPSCRIVLNAKKEQSEVEEGGLFNPFWKLYERGIGSLFYQGSWNLFDQIIVSNSLANPKENTLRFWKAEVFNRDFLIQKEGQRKGYPFRTFTGNRFQNGYSDHFPTLIYMIK